jgi:biotin carboxylase
MPEITNLLVTGCYRSGTTLLEKLLHWHPRVTVASQPMPALYHVVKQRFLDSRGLERRYPLNHLFLEDAYAPTDLVEFLASYQISNEDLDTVFSQLSLYSEGHWTPEIAGLRDTFRPGTLASQLETLRGCITTLFPKAEPQSFIGSKEILCEELIPFLTDMGCTCVISIRDPRDVLASVNFGARYASMGEPRPILYTLRTWRKSVAFALALADNPRVRVVRYETLAAKPEATTRSLFESLGLRPLDGPELEVKDQYGASWTGNSSFTETTSVSTKPVGRFEKVLPHDVLRYVEAACLPEMRALGMDPVVSRRFERTALADYRPASSRVHAKFPVDYSHKPEHVTEECERFAHVFSGTLAQAEQSRWFIHPSAYRKLVTPRLLFLGAGPNQLPAIRIASEMGWHVTTLDNLADSPGHRLSHAREHCSTTDIQGVLAIARRLGVNGIATFASDVATPTVAHVAGVLGLRGAQPASVSRLSQKSELRRVQQEIGIPAPGFIVATSRDELIARLSSLRGKVVFKPEDASGSKGISSADIDDRAACESAFSHAIASSRCGRICVEEHLEGEHLSADGYIDCGRVVQMLCTEKQRTGFMIDGHVVPSRIAAADEDLIREQVHAIATHVGLQTCFFDLDAVVTPKGPVIIEISPRLGGNGIPMLFARAAGLQLTEASLRLAMGEPFELHRADSPRRMASWVFGAPRAGRLAGIADEATVRAKVPELEKLLIGRSIGEQVRPMENGADLVGYAIFSIPEGCTFHEMTQRLAAALQIEVQ